MIGSYCLSLSWPHDGEADDSGYSDREVPGMDDERATQNLSKFCY